MAPGGCIGYPAHPLINSGDNGGIVAGPAAQYNRGRTDRRPVSCNLAATPPHRSCACSPMLLPDCASAPGTASTPFARRVSRWTKPHPIALPLGVVADVARSRRELLLENALLRQQVLVLRRAVKRPVVT